MKNTAKAKANRESKYQTITDKLISLLEKGTRPWVKPWHSTPYSNFITKHAYSGINPLLCQLDLMENEHEHPYYLSFKQAKELNWFPRKGSKATILTYVGKYAREVENPFGENEIQSGIFTKFYSVFNLSCIDDSRGEKKIADLLPDALLPNNPDFELPRIEKFVSRQKVPIYHGGDRACYSSACDRISMPEFEKFSSNIRYYQTLIHELSHATGHPDRLNRKLGNRFGSTAYAREELIAEMSAAFVCGELGIVDDLELEHHASYLDSWLTVLKSDNKAFFQAASQARAASDYLIKQADLTLALATA